MIGLMQKKRDKLLLATWRQLRIFAEGIHWKAHRCREFCCEWKSREASACKMEHSPMLRPTERALNNTWTLEEVGFEVDPHHIFVQLKLEEEVSRQKNNVCSGWNCMVSVSLDVDQLLPSCVLLFYPLCTLNTDWRLDFDCTAKKEKKQKGSISAKLVAGRHFLRDWKSGHFKLQVLRSVLSFLSFIGGILGHFCIQKMDWCQLLEFFLGTSPSQSQVERFHQTSMVIFPGMLAKATSFVCQTCIFCALCFCLSGHCVCISLSATNFASGDSDLFQSFICHYPPVHTWLPSRTYSARLWGLSLFYFVCFLANRTRQKRVSAKTTPSNLCFALHACVH